MNKTHGEDVLGNNTEYYKYIFKKTEKIVCAVFYITRKETNIAHTDPLISDLENGAQTLMSETLHSLTETGHQASPRVRAVMSHLVALESKLRMVHAAGYMPHELLNVFVDNIDAVGRTAQKYMQPEQENPLFVRTEGVVSVPQQASGRTRTVASQGTPAVPSSLGSATRTASAGTNRTARILAVLQEKGQASIKDVSDVITDCSEKTIQRELNALIKDGSVVREGERRWSKYSAV